MVDNVFALVDIGPEVLCQSHNFLTQPMEGRVHSSRLDRPEFALEIVLYFAGGDSSNSFNRVSKYEAEQRATG